MTKSYKYDLGLRGL